MRKGFTLVELSIVLVIIGLLTGGILVAQSMISTVKILRFTQDISQYEVSINMFRMNFKSQPGDSSLIEPAGDGDGAVESNVGCNGLISTNESAQAFPQMSATNMIKTSYEAYSPVACAGPHSNTVTDQSLAGVIRPYTELDSRAAALTGYKYSPIYAETSTGIPPFFNLRFSLGRDDFRAFITKMGVSIEEPPAGNQVTREGLQIQACYDIDWDSSFPCRDDSIVISEMTYAF